MQTRSDGGRGRSSSVFEKNLPDLRGKSDVLRAAIESLEVRRLFAAITVTTVADDLSPGDGSVSLREAITAINAGNDLGDTTITAQNPGTFGSNDTIDFNIPGAGVHTINVGSDASAAGIALPIINNSVLIDGYTQGVASVNTLANGDNAVILVELNGGAGGLANDDGLHLHAGDITVRGLAINRFNGPGIHIDGLGGDTISGNFIGTDASGTAARGNVEGIGIIKSDNNLVGGTTAAARNVISGNSSSGVLFSGNNGRNLVEGNFIGTDVTGTADLGNRGDGVFLLGASQNIIGGTVAAAGNTIAFNHLSGVNVLDGSSIGNTFRHNSIFGNLKIGIDLANNGVTLNDGGDADGGENNLQNSPVLSTSDTSASGTTITGSLNSLANQAFLIDFYSNPQLSPAPSGQGRTFIGTLQVITDNNGNVQFSPKFAAVVPAGQFISATATSTVTSPFGDTSEFSPFVDVSGPVSPPPPPVSPPPPPASPPPPPVMGGGVLTTQKRNFTANHGQTFNEWLGTFTDAAGFGSTSKYTVSINWGDGTAASNGSVGADPTKAKQFRVYGSHKYTKTGAFHVTITIHDSAGNFVINSVITSR